MSNAGTRRGWGRRVVVGVGRHGDQPALCLPNHAVSKTWKTDEILMLSSGREAVKKTESKRRIVAEESEFVAKVKVMLAGLMRTWIGI